MAVLFHNALNTSGNGIVYDPPLPISYAERTLEYEDMGGPSHAEIDADGALPDLLRLREKLGRGVTIFGENGDPIWWGICEEVAITDGGIKHTYSLRDVVTSAAIAYEKVGSGAESVGERTTSAWADDPIGAAKYGRLQTLLSGGRLSEDEAGRRVALTLKDKASPYAGSESGNANSTAAIYCVGVWDFMAREYYRDRSNIHSYWPQSNYQQWFGEGSALDRVAARVVLPGNPTISGGGFVFQSFNGDQVTVGLAKWLDPVTKLPNTSTTTNSEVGTLANYRVICEIYTEAMTYVADCHHSRDTQYSYSGAQHQDVGIDDTQIFITRINGWNGDYGRGGSHNVAPSPKWFCVGDKLRIGFGVGTNAPTLGDLITVTEVDAVAHGYYRVQRGAGALTQSNRVYMSLPGTFVCRASIDAKDISQTLGQVTFKNFVNADNMPVTFPVSSADPIWIVLSRSDPPTGAHGEYVGRGYYIVDGSTTMGYTECDKPFLDGKFTMRGASLVWDAQNTVWRHLIPARDNVGGGQILFKISGTRQTTDQMGAMAAQSQWISGFISETASGRETVPYRSGERTIQDELIALLKLGDSNGNAYVPKINPKRQLVISVKKDGTTQLGTGSQPNLRIPATPITRKRDGSLISPTGAPLPLVPPPLGEFVQYEGEAGEPFYVEAAVYDPETGQLDLRPPNRGQLYDVSSIEEG